MAPVQGPDGDFSRLRAARSCKSMRQVEGDDFLSLLRAHRAFFIPNRHQLR